ncbi:trypsin-like peptidase domain-containing protein [uncultured Shewanella sp.]|uniref:trypsin-like serine peptidase n=1 Tax=uncultured Shewanella sp. TaxID=173975 RepID=UPI002608134A|nr:trypsin-like peptidase domain-containing protein [uncultured Shewanella sp.]
MNKVNEDKPMKSSVILLCLHVICVNALSVSLFPLKAQIQLSPLNSKGSFIEGKDKVLMPVIEGKDLREHYSLDERAIALSTIAVTPNGTQFEAVMLPATLTLFEQAIQSFEIRGLDTEIFIVPHQMPSKEPKNPETYSPHVVIGTDERLPITDTRVRPHLYNGKIDTGCTGTLISPLHVLTAGHCVSDGEGQWYRELDFTAGQNGNDKPWETMTWKKVMTTTAWHTQRDYNFDYALIVLDDAPHGGHSGWGTYSDGLHSVTGYPADKSWRTMWTDSGETSSSTYRVCYTLDTSGGQSGSGIKDERGYVRGVHTTGALSQNCGTRLTSTVFTMLQNWMAATP